jgi:hypothetical protein
MQGGEGGSPGFPRPLLEEPSSIMLWGHSRGLLDRAALQIARRITPRYGWIEIQGRPESRDPEEGRCAGKVPSDRRFIAESPQELIPDSVEFSVGIRTIVRTGGPPKAAERLVGLGWLPKPVRDMARRLEDPGRTGAVVVTNSERLVPRLPRGADDVRRLVEVLREERISLLVTVRVPPLDAYRAVFDYVFRAEPSREGSESLPQVIAERVPDSTIRLGEPISFFRSGAYTRRPSDETGADDSPA